MKNRNMIHWLWLGLVICLLDAAPAHAFYNPQQGRWINRDPIEEQGSVNLYACLNNNALSRYDYLGREDIEAVRGKFDKWYNEQMADMEWVKKLPNCPCNLEKIRCVTVFGGYGGAYASEHFEFIAPDGWSLVFALWSGFTLDHYHPAGMYDLRQEVGSGSAGQQCVYDKDGKLITHGPGAGTPDRAGSTGGKWAHKAVDADPYNWALLLDGDPDKPKPDGVYFQKYIEVRQPNEGKDTATGKPCPRNP